eukprot:CAMPEP_0182441994 /NCGR_PEP_ID=MMETSP1172-20130603/974_1 /TAXON_ID=708627 /ORGANISM="Timspurckia oligopyrenoides, Strain CCMP3278" /LENGTH=613 /DNA_ID=CAMNT_0024636643 /DNA_START=37 /DNA_END=1878 /DNA_ORIENTATION=-
MKAFVFQIPWNASRHNASRLCSIPLRMCSNIPDNIDAYPDLQPKRVGSGSFPTKHDPVVLYKQPASNNETVNDSKHAVNGAIPETLSSVDVRDTLEPPREDQIRFLMSRDFDCSQITSEEHAAKVIEDFLLKETASPYSNAAPTQRQLDYLSSRGVDISRIVSKEQASELIESEIHSQNSVLSPSTPTPRQIQFLASRGIDVSGVRTKEEASELIEREIQSNNTQELPPTEKQIALLVREGMDISGITTRRKATEMIERIIAKSVPTAKQMHFLSQSGIDTKRVSSKSEATDLISDLIDKLDPISDLSNAQVNLLMKMGVPFRNTVKMCGEASRLIRIAYGMERGNSQFSNQKPTSAILNELKGFGANVAGICDMQHAMDLREVFLTVAQYNRAVSPAGGLVEQREQSKNGSLEGNSMLTTDAQIEQFKEYVMSQLNDDEREILSEKLQESWGRAAATSRQIAFLEKEGIEPQFVYSKGFASGLIEVLVKTKSRGFLRKIVDGYKAGVSLDDPDEDEADAFGHASQSGPENNSAQDSDQFEIESDASEFEQLILDENEDEEMSSGGRVMTPQDVNSVEDMEALIDQEMHHKHGTPSDPHSDDIQYGDGRRSAP